MNNENENEKPQLQVENSEASLEAVLLSKEVSSEDKPVKKDLPKKSPSKKVGEVEHSSRSDAESVKKEPEPPASIEPGRYAQLLSEKGFYPDSLGKDANGTEMIAIKSEEFLEVSLFLKDNPASRFDLLVSVSGVDWKDHLEAVYHVYSTFTFEQLVLKVTAVDEKIPSVVSVWQTADWHEREAYDLFGIQFEGHPNLQRILMPLDWIGYPMRKDYKVDDPRLVWNER